MPRKKPNKPEPIESVLVKDSFGDTLFEVYAEEDWPKERGWNNRLPYLGKFNIVLEKVVNDYLGPSGKKRLPPTKDYMLSATLFAQQCQLWGLGGEDGTDDSSFRKKLYKDIRFEITGLTNAIDENKKLGKV